MRTRKKDINNLIKVGAFLTALTVVLMIMIMSIGKENSIFDRKANLKARVENVSNLKTGSFVELKGIRVGTVQSINIINEEEVEVIFSVLEKELKWIKQDSKVAISNAGLVGDKFLEISGGTKDAPTVNPDKDVLRSEGGGDFKAIISKGESIASVTERILMKVDNILTNMENGKQLVATLDNLNKSSQNLETITRELKDANIGDMVKTVNGSMEKLSKASGSMEKIMTQIEKGPGTMHSMIYDDALHDDLRALLGGAQRNRVIKYFIRQSIQNSEKKSED